MGMIEIIVATVFFGGIACALIVMFTFIARQNKKLAAHTCGYCRAPVSPRAVSCPTCGEPIEANGKP